jgi:hypothetical protein
VRRQQHQDHAVVDHDLGADGEQVKAPTTQINGDGMVQIKGGVVMIN